MNDPAKDAVFTRWETLSQQVQSMQDALKGFTLMGVLDGDTNHIASMQEEIDRKTREALMAYWLGIKQGELPQGIA